MNDIKGLKVILEQESVALQKAREIVSVRSFHSIVQSSIFQIIGGNLTFGSRFNDDHVASLHKNFLIRLRCSCNDGLSGSAKGIIMAFEELNPRTRVLIRDQ